MMMEVGVRELRENLRAFLDHAKTGDVIVVTERGKPIARLTGANEDAAYERLVAQGVVTPARRPRQPVDVNRLPRLRGRPTLSDIVIEQRRSSKY